MNNNKRIYTTNFYRQIKKIRSDSGKQLMLIRNATPIACTNNDSNHIFIESNAARPLSCPVNSDSSNEILHDNSVDNNIEEILQSEKGTDGDDILIESDIEDQLNLMNDLRQWALTNKVTLIAVSELLKILQKNEIDINIKDARTLLKTPSNINIRPMGGGQFWYDGVKENLSNCLLNIEQIPKTIQLIVNVDGIAPFNSTGKEFWPILVTIADIRNMKPFTVAIYYGQGKPPLEDFFAEFIDEMHTILEHGITLSEHKVLVQVKCFACDTPARIYIKGTPNFNSTSSSCIKCTVEGDFDKRGRHMSYPRFDCHRRTNEDFRNKIDADHHVRDTPLVQLPINMVDQFPIADNLHLIHLGITIVCIYKITFFLQIFLLKFKYRTNSKMFIILVLR